MLWRVSLAVAVVCVGGICNSCVRADVMSRLIVPRDYGVKLCGREFIRAVIFTCGGSRWKRSTDLEPFQWTSLSGITAEDSQTRQRGAGLADTYSPPPIASSYSLADVLTLYRATSNRQQSSPSRPAPLGEYTVSDKQVENRDAAERLLSNKKKRNFSLGVAGMCCNQGCTKNDIGRLC
ncbi:prorelaxin H1 [Xenentodon cancila]